MQEALRKASTPLVGALLAATLFVGYTISNTAFATHQPADKTTAAASSIDLINGSGTPVVVLREEMKVSSPSDLIIQLTSECSLLNYLQTGEATGASGETDISSSEGRVEMWVTVDDKIVPVSTADADEDPTNGVQADDGRVVFCNRTYSRQVADSENAMDGVDTEKDFIRTRSANAFNWFALDTGFVYDNPANGNNILEIEVWAEYTHSPRRCTQENPLNESSECADAFVGRRSLIIEPVHAANDENTGPAGEGGTTPLPSQSPTSAPAPTCTPQGNGNNCKN